MSSAHFSVVVPDERHADQLARDLAGLVELTVATQTDGTWMLTFKPASSHAEVVQVLGAVRRALGAENGASATVLLDGREYVLDGA
jgi:hypothetical protein